MTNLVETARAGLSEAEKGHSLIRGRLDAATFPKYVLVPGDPDRVDVMAGQWDSGEVVQLERGYKVATGIHKGVPIAAMSSGMGSPSLEFVFTDLAALGAHTMIRVGTTGTPRDEIDNGDLIVNDAFVRLDGLTNLYVRPEFPAAASYDVTLALVDAAQRLGHRFHVGTGVTTGSFYAGQGRTAFGGYVSAEGQAIFEEMRRAGMLNFEMEGAALFTLCRIAGIRCGAVCAVIAHRTRGAWNAQGGVERACLVAADAVASLAAWDERARAAGRGHVGAADVGGGA